MGKELRYPFGFIKEKKQINEANRLIREIGFTSKLINAVSAVGNLSTILFPILFCYVLIV